MVTECCSESRMRSRTSRGVSEWSGGKDLYMGSCHADTGKFRGHIGIVPGPPEGFRGPTSYGGPYGLYGEGNQPKWAGAPHPPRVSNPRCLGPLGGRTSPLRGWFPPNYSPLGPSGQVDPPGGPPEPLRWSRYNTDKPRNLSGD